jgi:protein-disulfide isomerase
MKRAHTIEIFSAGCPLCKHLTHEAEIGKCKGCSQTIYDIDNMTEEIRRKMRDYGVTSVPTTIIDGNIKVVGIPDFPWICDDELYQKLNREYPLKRN